MALLDKALIDAVGPNARGGGRVNTTIALLRNFCDEQRQRHQQRITATMRVIEVIIDVSNPLYSSVYCNTQRLTFRRVSNRTLCERSFQDGKQWQPTQYMTVID